MLGCLQKLKQKMTLAVRKLRLKITAAVKKEHAYSPQRRIFIGINIAVSLLFVALVFALFLGDFASAFLWAKSTVSAETEAFYSSLVSIEVENATEKELKNFSDALPAINAQITLMDALNIRQTTEAKDEYFTQWCKDNLEKDYFKETAAAARFSLLQREYMFRNESTIPVYFRIDRATVTNGMDITLAAFWSMDDGVTQNIFAYDALSGSYYIAEPVDTGIKKIAVSFTAMVLNTGEDPGSCDFGADFAEIIQVTNNAVFLASGWHNFADKLTPYLLVE